MNKRSEIHTKSQDRKSSVEGMNQLCLVVYYIWQANGLMPNFDAVCDYTRSYADVCGYLTKNNHIRNCGITSVGKQKTKYQAQARS